MNKYKKVSCLLMVMCSVVSLSGCGKKASTNTETPYYTVALDGTKLYLAEDDADVSKVSEIGIKYVTHAVNVNYQATENAFDELDFYTKETKEMYVEYEYIEGAVETSVYYEQVQELVDNKVADIQFYELDGERKALMKCEYISKITHATDEYFEAVGIKADTNYRRTMSIFFIVEDGEWKIDNYDVTAREEVS